MQIDDVYHIDGLEVLKGSKLLRTSARAVKNHSQNADVFQHAVALLNMLLTDYQSSSCFDALVEEVLDSNFTLEMEIAVRDQAQVTWMLQHQVTVDQQLLMTCNIDLLISLVMRISYAVGICDCKYTFSLIWPQDQQAAQQSGSQPTQVQLDAAIRSLKQLGGWQAQHRDHMRTDVMQAMEESSDDESTVADGSQINMAANASSFGSLPVPDRYGSGHIADQGVQKVPTQQGQTKAHRSRGLVSLIKDALRRHWLFELQQHEHFHKPCVVCYINTHHVKWDERTSLTQCVIAPALLSVVFALKWTCVSPYVHCWCALSRAFVLWAVSDAKLTRRYTWYYHMQRLFVKADDGAITASSRNHITAPLGERAVKDISCLLPQQWRALHAAFCCGMAKLPITCHVISLTSNTSLVWRRMWHSTSWHRYANKDVLS